MKPGWNIKSLNFEVGKERDYTLHFAISMPNLNLSKCTYLPVISPRRLHAFIATTPNYLQIFIEPSLSNLAVSGKKQAESDRILRISPLWFPYKRPPIRSRSKSPESGSLQDPSLWVALHFYGGYTRALDSGPLRRRALTRCIPVRPSTLVSKRLADSRCTVVIQPLQSLRSQFRPG